MSTARTYLWLALWALVFALGMAVAPAQAATATANLSWSQPESREDGTPLAADEIAAYRVYQAVDGEIPDDPEAAHIVIESGTTQTVQIELDPRPEPYAVRFGVRAVATDGAVSALSNIVARQFVMRSTAPPGAPTNLQLEITCGDGCQIQVVE